MVYAISSESGISNYNTTVNTVFGAKYTEQSGTHMTANNDICFSYALKTPITDLAKTLVVLVTNSTRYAGTCTIYSNGKAVAICPMSSLNYPYDFRGVVQHEAAGHGFAKLADEYVSTTGQIPQTSIDQLVLWQSYNCYLNVDLTNNLSNILWKHFIGLPNYSYVGAYQGAYYYSLGVWRPESGSVMINNINYINAPGRELIVKRIKSLAGQTYSFEEFKTKDIMDLSPPTKAAGMIIDPSMFLPPPVLIK